VIETPPPRPSTNGELVERVNRLRLDGVETAAAAPKSRTAWLPWILCIALAISWAGVGIRGYRTSAAPTAEVPKDKPAATASSSITAAAAPSRSGEIFDRRGYLIPARQIAVSPIDVAGRVVELNIAEGKKFNQNDVLAKIEDISFKAQAEEARANLASAERRLESAKAKLAVMLPASVRKIEIDQLEEELRETESTKSRAQDELDRLTRLGAGTAAEREVNQAKFDLQGASARVLRLKATLAILKEGPRQEQKNAAEADVKSADAEVKAAEARLRQAEWRLANCTIRAPITGTVLTKKAELFNLVNPLAFAATSGSVCDMADLADMEVDVEIEEREIAKLTNGLKCRVRVDAYSDRKYDGTLDRIMATSNRARQVVNVRVKITLPAGEEPGKFLKPEMGAVVTFLSP
jgi:multidrug resistance efflux pump